MVVNRFAEFDLRIFRIQPSAVHVELRFVDSDQQAVRDPLVASTTLDPRELRGLELRPESYGKSLSAQLFSQETTRREWAEALGVVEARDLRLRLRLALDSTASDLQGLRWELLRDPQTNDLLATSEKILFFRFLYSQNWRPAKLRRRGELTAVVAVSAPTDLAKAGLAEVRLEAEIERAVRGFGDIPTRVVGRDEPLTLTNLAGSLGFQEVDVLYLVCHGQLKDGESILYLQDKAGAAAKVKGAELATCLGRLPEPPRLVVLASCESGGKADGTTLGALAPLLAEAGIPAVLAMQGQITMATVEKAMPAFLTALSQDGQIDLALARARALVKERADAWMLALYLRLQSGRIWYEPGFGQDEDTIRWPALCGAITAEDFTPVVGWGFAERFYGSPHDLAHRLAGDKFPLAPFQRNDLAMVYQYLKVDQDSEHHVLKAAEGQMRSEIIARFPDLEGEQAADLQSLLARASEIERRDEHDPYAIIAGLPASVYINASSDNLLEEALRAAGKKPYSLYPGWKPELEPPRETRLPTVQEPLIYCIFGHFSDRESLVLTEDDYFDFLIGFSENRDQVPPVVRNALSGNSLLFLGFQLTDWSFRVLYRLVLHQAGRHRSRKRTHAAVQVDPEGNQLLDVEQARKYLKAYYGDENISIFWGSSEDFLGELDQRREKVPTRSTDDEF